MISNEDSSIDFRADLEKLDWSQSLELNKQVLVKILEKNNLYYNYTEIDDKNIKDLISENDYKFNKSFYGMEAGLSVYEE